MQKVEELYDNLDGYTISTAESCTAGLLSFYLTSVEGASCFFKRGFIVYDDAAKIDLLKIDCDLIRKFTAVSPEVCEAMTKNCQKLSKTDISIAMTGYADFYNNVKDNGYIIIGVKIGKNDGKICEKFYNEGRNLNRMRAVEDAISMLIDELCRLKAV